MLSKLSVKKPQTIFVTVFMVIILGFVSFSNMTPDLLPNINLPYAMVMTVYVGATPEEVEEEVTQPLEESMATLENIVNVTSTSSENVSIVILEFTDDADMDNIISEIREEINNISDAWNDFVSTPNIIAINPDMMPVTITAVNYAGYDAIDLTEFVEDELLNKLEGTTGVASIDVMGSVTEQVNIFLSQEKIDALNEKIQESVAEQFAEASDEIAEGESAINDGLSELESADAELADAEDALLEGQDALASETAAAQAELIAQKFVLAETKAELEEQLALAQDGQTELEDAIAGLEETSEAYIMLGEAVSSLELVKMAYPYATSEEQAVWDATLAAMGTDYASIDITIATYEAQITAIDTELMASMGIDGTMLPTSISELELQLAAVESGVTQLEDALEQVESGDATLTEALEEVNYAQISGALEIAEGYTQIVVGQSAIDSALAELESAQTSLEEAKAELETAEETASASANIEITMDMVNLLLTAQNFQMPAGYITEEDTQYLIRVGDEIETLEELQDLALMYIDIEGIGTVRLSDVAEVAITDTSADIYTKVDGEDGIILSFTKQSTAATADVSDNLNEAFEDLESEYLGLSFMNLTDQGTYIDLIVNNVLQSLIFGGIFAILILLLFLKDIRPTFIIACSIPVSLLFAITLMYFSGITLNIISLSGLAIGVGMLVDNSVVVIENIYRMRAEGEDRLKAAVKGANQVAGAICASTLTTICVFAPIVFVDGLTRQLFTDMALTIAYSLGASLIVAITLVPAMASGMLKNEKTHKEGFFKKLVAVYEKLARASLKHKWVVLIGSVVLLITSTYMAISQGFIFMPSMSGTQISVTVTLDDEDATFEDMTAIAGEIYERIEDIEEIESTGIMVDESTGITMYAVMTDDAERKDSEVSLDIEERCEDLPCTVDASGAMDMTSMMSALSGSGVSVQIYGEDLNDLMEEAELIAAQLEAVDGVAEVSTGLEENDVEYSVVVDPEKAVENGLTVAEVYQYVAAAITTETTSINVSIDGDNKEIVIYQDEALNMTVEDLNDYTMEFTDMTGEDRVVKLTEVAEIIETESMDSISRENQKRTLTVSASIEDDYNVTLVTSEVEKVLDDYETIEGNTISVGGESDSIMEAIEQLGLMLLLGVVMIYFIMVAQFQSYKLPFIVMFTIPLAFTGGFLGLLVTGKDVSVIAMIGFIMLAGIIVNNGIVLIDYINVLRLDGMEKQEAIVEAGKTRIRPILMTATTTILGLVVMALGRQVGTEMMQPIAIVCIGGLIYATIMTLFVVPAMYDILSKKNLEKRIVD